ncbi:hypothetical protein FQR65_LT19760 [Abscondita terminalis]|nr:hypothetical protein FQR65_LT19760 [Abscondita terminalis]
MMSNPVVHIANLTVQYPNQSVLQRLNWQIEQGENWLIGGKSGSGKTTLALAIADQQRGPVAKSWLPLDKAERIGNLPACGKEVVQELAKIFGRRDEHMFIDNAAMQLVKNPKKFDVIAGSWHVASASVGDGTRLLRTIPRLSATTCPDEKQTNAACFFPVCSAPMLDISFGLQTEAKELTQAVADTLKAGWRTGDIANTSTPADTHWHKR